MKSTTASLHPARMQYAVSGRIQGTLIMNARDHNPRGYREVSARKVRDRVAKVAPHAQVQVITKIESVVTMASMM